ncbi:MAG: hypothetical protein Q4F79_12610 [Eubacteriales bacterium]|nr:hypothetical protein [Eubacteriales bacterium]
MMAWIPTLRVSSTKTGTFTALPEPSTLTFAIQDVDSASTGRGEDGNMIRDRVAIKRKLSMTWYVLNATDANKLLDSAIENKDFWCIYYDPKEASYVTKNFYVGDRQMGIWLRRPDGSYMYESISADFIEM